MSPVVGKRHFPYTPAGRKAAKTAAKKSGAKVIFAPKKSNRNMKYA